MTIRVRCAVRNGPTGDLHDVEADFWGSNDLVYSLTELWRVSHAMKDQNFQYEVAAAFLSKFKYSECAFQTEDICTV